MTSDYQLKEAFRKLVAGMGLKYLEQMRNNLDPDAILQQVAESFAEQVKETVTEVVQDPNSTHMASLMEQIYRDIDEDSVIAAIAQPLAENLALWLREEGADLVVEAIMRRIDIDSEEIARLVSEQLAQRLQVTTG